MLLEASAVTILDAHLLRVFFDEHSSCFYKTIKVCLVRVNVHTGLANLLKDMSIPLKLTRLSLFLMQFLSVLFSEGKGLKSSQQGAAICGGNV